MQPNSQSRVVWEILNKQNLTVYKVSVAARDDFNEWGSKYNRYAGLSFANLAIFKSN